jgi:hypothetical protein
MRPVRFYSYTAPKLSDRADDQVDQFTPGWAAQGALPAFLYYYPFIPAFGIHQNAAFVRSRSFGQDAL